MVATAGTPSQPVVRRPGPAIVALSAAMLAWGVTGVIAKSVDMGGMALAAYRTSVGAAVLVVALLATGRRLTWHALRVGAPGGVFMGLDLVLFFSAVKLTTVANATVIGALQPALVILISGPLLKEKVAKGAARWAVVGLAGTALVVFGASGLPGWSVGGDLLATLTLGVWTGYFIATRMARGQLGALEYSTVTAIVASFVAWPAAAVFGQDLSWPTWSSWGWIVVLAVVAGVGGHFLMSVSIPHLPLWASSTMTLSIPVVSTIAAAAFLDERVAPVQIVGIAVVLVALALQMFGVFSLILALIARKNPVAFFRETQEAMLMAFSTASSNATLPTSLRVADTQLKLPRPIARFVLTIGATANQNGTAMFEGVTVIFLAQFFGIDLTLGQQLVVMLICILGGIGTAGVPAGSLPVIALILGTVGVPPEGIGLVLGVDRFLDMCRTALNVIGDLVCAQVISSTSRPEDFAAPEAGDG